MIKPGENTDPLFRQLNDFESHPSQRVWEGIESHLAEKEKGKQRGLLPLWRWGAAAIVFLAVGLLWMFDGQKEVPRDEHVSYLESHQPRPAGIQSTENQHSDSHQKKAEGETSAEEEVKSDPFTKDEKSKIKLNNTKESLTRTENNTSNQETPCKPEEPGNKKEYFTGKMQSRPAHLARNHIRTALTPSTLTEKVPPFQQSKASTFTAQKSAFIIGGEYSPTYTFREASGPTTANNSEKGMITGGGGLSLTLKMNDRWRIETGINYARLGQEVTTKTRSDRSFGLTQSKGEINITGIQLDNTMGVIRNTNSSPKETSENKIFRSPSNEIVEIRDAGETEQYQPQLEQALEYVKIPVTIRYKIFKNQNIGISLAGGFSSNWLVGNEAYLSISGKRQYLGNTEGISQRSISSHAGVGITFPVFRELHLRMEPRVDYFITDISNATPGHYQPYSFGVFTGIFYEF